MRNFHPGKKIPGFFFPHQNQNRGKNHDERSVPAKFVPRDKNLVNFFFKRKKDVRLKIVDGNYGPNKAGIAQKSNFCYHILVKHAIENGERVGE